ncbi:helix-turn-helix domain-containing protein [Planctobacterium marinum]|uniref:HTH araC/xylS-type domain-containing protein n=1 Tax=Planctobacterium marinum TaxID=1631968 RepID=A0AA48HNG5_9ALTE|nr:hypothetical protein MACH26_39750 [Planctobacterium marinum]
MKLEGYAMKLYRNIRHKNEQAKRWLREQLALVAYSDQNLTSGMQISPATLKRKLKQHGTSFQKLQDLSKAQTALFDLKVKNLTNEQAAQSSQFKNLPNFRRTIKRWTGMTPSELKSG